MVEKKDGDACFAAFVQGALAAQSKGETAGVPSEVKQQCVLGVEIEKSFVVLSEREMRKESGLHRIPRMSLKSLPQLTLPSQPGGGEPEVLYAFADPDQPFRKARVKSFVGECLSETLMEPSKVFWADQGKTMLVHASTEQCAKLGVADTLQREAKLPTWDAFFLEKLATKVKGEGGSRR